MIITFSLYLFFDLKWWLGALQKNCIKTKSVIKNSVFFVCAQICSNLGGEFIKFTTFPSKLHNEC